MKKILYVGYAGHKRLMNGLLVSPMIDALILEEGKHCLASSITLGKVDGQELVPTRCVPDNIPLLSFLRAQFIAGCPRIKDVRFVFALFRPNQYPDLINPLPRWKWRFFSLRTYLVARYYSVLFAADAAAHDEARVLVYYGARMLGVVMAFRKLDKPVFDVQHGYIGESHNAYNRPDVCNSESLLEPTGYVLWSKEFHSRTPELCQKQAFYTDYLHLKTFGPHGKSRSSQASVLIATQWGTPLPSFLAGLVDLFPTIQWILRLHPLESDDRKDLLPLLSKPNVRKGVAGCSLSEDLYEVCMQITVNSSTVHEAAAIGVRSLFTDPVGTERFAFEIKRGLACLVDESNVADEIRRALDSADSSTAQRLNNDIQDCNI